MSRTVLLAGFGAFGALHADAWRQLPDIRLLLAEPDEVARARALHAGFAEDDVVDDVAKALDRVDLVDIVSPPETHLPVARAALARNRPVLIEKPATRTRADALGLIEAAGATPVQVGLVLRAHPLVQRARALLAEGAIGPLLFLSGDFSGWKRMRADSSLLENDGVHFLDLMRHLADSPVAEVDAVSWSRLGGDRADDIRIDLRHANGLTAELRLGLPRGGEVEDTFVPGAVTRKTLTLCGTAGTLSLDFNAGRLYLGEVEYSPAPGGWAVAPASRRWEAASATPVSLLTACFIRFLDCLDHGRPPLCDAAQRALELARVMAAVDRALARPTRTGIPVAENLEVS